MTVEKLIILKVTPRRLHDFPKNRVIFCEADGMFYLGKQLRLLFAVLRFNKNNKIISVIARIFALKNNLLNWQGRKAWNYSTGKHENHES